MSAEFDARGHTDCPTWARLWKAHYRPTDPATLDNLAACFTRECRQCKIDASPELQAIVAGFGGQQVLPLEQPA